MATLRHHSGARRTYRSSNKRMRLVGLIVVTAILLFGFAQAVTAIKISFDRAVKVEALKDG